MSSLHGLYNLKLPRIWNKFLKTAHKIKVLVQKTGQWWKPQQERVFWTACGDKDANPFKFWFSWPGGTHVQRGAGQEVSALQNAVASTVPLPAAGTHPPALSMLLMPGEGGSHPSPPNGEGTGRAKLTSIPCIQNLLLRVTSTKVIWRDRRDFLADYSLKINCSLPFVIHSGFEAACE